MAELTAETLAGIQLFRHLPAQDRKALADRCHAHRYAAKQEIVSHAEQSSDVYFIVSGEVRATIYSVGGREVAFRDLGAGDMFGDLSAIDGKPRSASVVAVADSFVISMTGKAFREVLQAYPTVAMAALQELVDLVRGLCERVIEMSTLGVKNRIHAELLRLSQKKMTGSKTAVLQPAPTHADIASRISTHREAVTRELNHLAQIGLLERRTGALVITDVPSLAHMVEEVHQHLK
jgi:CRP/FNR family transcriptional regulator, cyclic AMP receptor protein